MGQKGKKTAERRTRRRDNGMAVTAGVSPLPTRDQLTRTLQLLRAALRLWEAKHERLESPRVWRKDFGRTSAAAPAIERLDA
jgi:hypothetical protein